MLAPTGFGDYELIDAGGGERLERWGVYTVRRPEPVAQWPRHENTGLWHDVDLRYSVNQDASPGWQAGKGLPESWSVTYGDLRFLVKPTGFKQVGLFPEQAVNWQFYRESAGPRGASDLRVLNLFAYTGASTAVLASAGALVTHVDASRAYVRWAQENMALSSLGDRPVRFIVDDVVRFCERELRRGSRYDAIVMDPPSFGRGPGGEVWKIEHDLAPLIEVCSNLLTDHPAFFVVSFHTAGFRQREVSSMLSSALRRFHGTVRGDDLGLTLSSNGRVLPCGSRAIWSTRAVKPL